jgi:hypothetical protein
MNSTQPDTSDAPKPIDNPAGDAAGRVPPNAAFTVADIFLDRNGLRAIWGIALFLGIREALRYVVYPLLQALVPSAFNSGSPIAPRTVFASEGAGLLCVVAATWLMAKIERRKATVYGFRVQRGARNFLAGVAWGVALLSLLVAALRAAGLLVFDARLLFGHSVLRYGLIWLAGFLLVALLEEVFLRGYLQFTLTRALTDIYHRIFGPTRADAVRHPLLRLRFRPQFESGRVSARATRRRPGRTGLLPQPLAHRLALVGHWLPRILGLGAVLSIRRCG